jgi:acyl carrier protein
MCHQHLLFARNSKHVGSFLTGASANLTGSCLPELLMSIGSQIAALFTEVARDQNKILAPLSDDLGLLETGLDSLCFAIIVARLEDELGVDPFSTEDEIDFPVTVGDFIRLYEHATTRAVA